MNISKKNARQIANLVNTIIVSQIMLDGGYTRELWTIEKAEAIQDLGDKFGIQLPNYVALEAAL